MLLKKCENITISSLKISSLTYIRDSSEAFQLTCQTSRLKSRQHQNDGGNLALYHRRIPSCIICHWITRKKCENITLASLTYVCFVPAKGLVRGLSATCQTSLLEFWKQNYHASLNIPFMSKESLYKEKPFINVVLAKLSLDDSCSLGGLCLCLCLFFATPQIKMKTIQEKIERMDLTMARRPKGNYEAYIN